MTTHESDRPMVGVGVAIVDGDELLLIQRGSDPHRGAWAVPGGKVMWGETLAEAATREVKEETGLLVKLDEIIWVGETIDDDHHIVLLDFLGETNGGELLAQDDAIDARWVRIEDAYEMELTPTMYDLLEVLLDILDDDE